MSNKAPEMTAENALDLAVGALLDIWGDGSYKDIASQIAYDALRKLNRLPAKAKPVTDSEVLTWHKESRIETRKDQLHKQRHPMGLRP